MRATENTSSNVVVLHPCKVEGCRRRGLVNYRLLCRPHWAEQRAAEGHVCAHDGCSQGIVGRGLCRVHWQQTYKPVSRHVCQWDGREQCDKPARAGRKLCRNHGKLKLRRARHQTLSDEVQAWGITTPSDLVELGGWVYRFDNSGAFHRNRRQRASQGFGERLASTETRLAVG